MFQTPGGRANPRASKHSYIKHHTTMRQTHVKRYAAASHQMASMIENESAFKGLFKKLMQNGSHYPHHGH